MTRNILRITHHKLVIAHPPHPWIVVHVRCGCGLLQHLDVVVVVDAAVPKWLYLYILQVYTLIIIHVWSRLGSLIWRYVQERSLEGIGVLVFC